MADWKTRLDAFLNFTEYEILNNPGKVTAEIAQFFAESEFEKYRLVQDRLFKSDFDKMIEELEQKEKKGRKKEESSHTGFLVEPLKAGLHPHDFGPLTGVCNQGILRSPYRNYRLFSGISYRKVGGMTLYDRANGVEWGADRGISKGS
jgi:hypothetical protein